MYVYSTDNHSTQDSKRTLIIYLSSRFTGNNNKGKDNNFLACISNVSSGLGAKVCGN